VAGVAVTLIVDDAPAATVTVVACASLEGSALTVQPSGPWVVNPNTISPGVSTNNLRLTTAQSVDAPTTVNSLVLAPGVYRETTGRIQALVRSEPVVYLPTHDPDSISRLAAATRE